MRNANFALLILFKVFLLLLFSFVIVPFFFVDYGRLLNYPLGISLVVLEIATLIAILFISIRGLAFTLKFLLNPYKYFLDGLIVTEARKSLKYRIEKLSKSINAFSPTLLETESIPDLLTFGLTEDNSYIIASPSFLKKLDDDELTTVFLHEMFHIKNDVESQSFRMIFDKAVNTPINFLYVALAFTISFLPLPFVFSEWSLPTVFSSKLETILPIWNIFALFGLLPFGAALAALALFRTWKEGTMLSNRYLYIREVLADSYSSIISRKPLKLYSAIEKATKRRILSSFGFSTYDKISFGCSSEEGHHIRDDITLAEIFKTGMLSSLRDLFGLKSERGKTSCPIKHRLSLLKALQRLIYGNINIIQLKRPPHLMSLISKLKMPETVFSMLREKKVSFEEFCNYIGRKGSNFNLVECANLIRVEPFEAFLMLFAAVNSEIVDIKVKI